MNWPEWAWDFENYVIIVGASAGLIQLFYVLFFHLRIASHKSQHHATQQKLPPVSIIICARNESENLSKNLPHILSQDYPKYEVIVVNDRSFDDSEQILDAFSKTYKNFRWIKINRKAKVATVKNLHSLSASKEHNMIAFY